MKKLGVGLVPKIPNDKMSYVLRLYNFRIRISEVDPSIALVKDITANNIEYGLAEVTNVLRSKGIEKIIYDFSKYEGDIPKWVEDFDRNVYEGLNIEPRYIGIKQGLNPEIRQDCSLRKRIRPDLEFIETEFRSDTNNSNKYK